MKLCTTRALLFRHSLDMGHGDQNCDSKKLPPQGPSMCDEMSLPSRLTCLQLCTPAKLQPLSDGISLRLSGEKPTQTPDSRSRCKPPIAANFVQVLRPLNRRETTQPGQTKAHGQQNMLTARGYSNLRTSTSAQKSEAVTLTPNCSASCACWHKLAAATCTCPQQRSI